MTIPKNSSAKSEKRLAKLKDARRIAVRERRQQIKQAKVDCDRKIVLVGLAVLGQLERGECNEDEFRKMMDGALSRPSDRALFELD